MEQKQNLIYQSHPTLRTPYVFCGIGGWLNGGEASTGSLDYLIRHFRANRLAEMPVSPYHVYQLPGMDSIRPEFRMEEGLIAEAHLPRNEFFYATNPSSDHDLIFFMGTEPATNWNEYAETIVGLAKEYHATRLFTFGGVLDKTPHTREPKVSCSCTSPELREEMRKYNVTFSNYEGPATFNTMLLYTCRARSLEAVGFSVRATYYPEFSIVISHNPKAMKAILVRLNHLAGLNMSFKEIDARTIEFEEKLDAIRMQTPQFNTYVEDLEKAYVELPFREPLELSGDEGVRLAEEFLKKGKAPD